MESPLHFLLLLLCFFLSGFAALLYETAWAREFEFVFGTSELAVVSVLAAYMAGLAAGSAAAGRLVPRVRRPVLWYGVLELGIALAALAVPWAIRGATALLVAWRGGLPEPPDMASVAGSLFYVGVAFAVLVVPTAMMGATLPLLARHAVRRDEEIGRRVGALYATNTAGAVAGAVATGFVVLPALGLRGTVYLGAAVNALVFALAALLSRQAASAAGAGAAAPAHRAPFHWVLPLVTVSGAVSFTYEVLWTRLLGHIVGGTLQGFATMLGSFLLGIAIGSAVAARLARDPARAARGFAVAQLLTAALSLAAFVGMDWIPELATAIGAGAAGSLAHNAVIAAAGLLPSSLCIGAAFPFAVRLVARDETEAGPAAASVYVWNTLGSITGALAAGFWLIPALHFTGTLALAVGLNLALAIAAAMLVRPPLVRVAGLAVVGLAALLVVRPDTPWKLLRHSAMLSTTSRWAGEVDYFGVGRSSTVLLIEQWQGWRLTTNGLPESLISRDGPAPAEPEPARWLGMLPSLLRPDLEKMLVVGLGGGLTVEAVASPVREITVIELEDEVVHAHEWLATQRSRSPLSDPRVRLVVNDARGALELTDARFDAIVSQPSHPWTAGASHLYTREFFSLARQHLAPGGVFVQWIGIAFVDELMLRSMVATLLEAFPHVAVFRPALGSILFAASDEPFDPLATAGRALAASPEDFARFDLRTAEDVAAAWALDTAQAREFARDAPVVTDDRNPLATQAARIGKRTLSTTRCDEMLAPFEPLAGVGADVDRVYLAHRLALNGFLERAKEYAETIPDAARRLTALGWVKSVVAPQTAAATFRHALAADPASQSARFGLVRMLRKRLEEAEPAVVELAAPLQGSAGAVAAGWRHASRGEWDELRGLEPALEGVAPRDPSRAEALRLRVLWRTHSADPAERDEATALAARMLAASWLPDDLLLAARAYAEAGRPNDALFLVDFLSRSRRRPAAQQAGLALLDGLRPQVDAGRWEEIHKRLSQTPRARGAAGVRAPSAR
jgi:spermidine synthase